MKTDNRFTSSQLAADLHRKQITLLETMRKTSENFPLNLKQGRQEELDQAGLALVTGKC